MAYSTLFRTRSELVPCRNLESPSLELCALDIGYSSVKGISSTMRSCIPSFVKEQPGELIGPSKPTDILYRDETGAVFAVGSLAMEALSAKDTNDASNTLFARNRYFSPSFLILARVGLAIQLGNKRSDRPLFLQTGLPPAYRKADTALLKEALAGKHEFSLKIGDGKWCDYSFTLAPDAIDVIDQPIGSVFSASKRNDGTTVICPDGRTYIDHRLLVVDGGFGTLDVYSITNRAIDSSNTFSDLGMKAVFGRASDVIFDKYGKEVHPHTIQQYLDSGVMPVMDRKTRSTKSVDINVLLRDANRYVFEKAMGKIETAYNDLEDYDYLLVTGGTGAAWYDMIRDRYRGMETLSVISASQNDRIAAIYNNVRGYYIYRALASKK